MEKERESNLGSLSGYSSEYSFAKYHGETPLNNEYTLKNRNVQEALFRSG
jgi:hypothetical protein